MSVVRGQSAEHLPDRPAGTTSRARIALVTQGAEAGGGVSTVALWVREGLRSAGYEVDIHDLATWSRDGASRRLVAPLTWGRRSLRRASGSSEVHCHWGANAVELEPMRYRPRAELTRVLSTYDLIQIVAGGPALANVAVKAGVPVVLQAATMARWERQSQLSVTAWPLRAWRATMTRAVDLMERRALRSVDGVLVWNEAMRKTVEPYCRAPVSIAAPGIDTDRFSPHSDGWQREGNLLSVCRLEDARKGLERIIRAYALIRQRHPSAPHLLLAGRGRLPAAERELIRELGVEGHVDVLPDVSPADLPDLYRNASVFLQASYEEGFGLSVVEAMASGLPVVTTRTEGTAVTMLDGETGWLVPQHPPTSVPETLASRTLDVLMGDGPVMSEKARSHATSTFSSRVSLARFIELYERLLHRPGSVRA